MLGCGAGGPQATGTTTAPGAGRPARSGTTAVAPPPASSQRGATSTASNCVDGACTVRVTCDGTVHSRRGPGPVSTRSSSINGATTITLDFAGRSSDAVVRC